MKMKKTGASPEALKKYLNEHSQYQAQQLGQADEAEICCGQVAGLITEVKSAGEVMNDVVKNLGSRFEELKQKLAVFL
jgi:NAD(P)H-dependent flavin oxidoreductase YrpB (nitropropane dioxygenase family)